MDNGRHQLLRVSVLIVLSCISLVGSFFACAFIGERYFFDRLFFKKSVKYGYLMHDVPYEKYGRRSSDLIALNNAIIGNTDDLGVLGAFDDKRFTVAIIGDSYVWGEGVHDTERFPILLEKKLNTVRPSRVISLGYPGNDVFDYLVLYQKLLKINPSIDLYIFGFVDNELMFNPYSENDELRKQLMINCIRPIIYNVSDNDSVYDKLLQASYDSNNGNICLYHQILPMLPKDDAIYFDMQYNKSEKYVSVCLDGLRDYELFVISPKYESAISDKDAYVSARDGHPSKYLHLIYSDVLFEYINTNTKFQSSVQN